MAAWVAETVAVALDPTDPEALSDGSLRATPRVTTLRRLAPAPISIPASSATASSASASISVSASPSRLPFQFVKVPMPRK